ncbi:hypothetical protein ACS5PN_18990 [Roseateles sp. NT4]|uniref:hypothetical protein n=1 Tax=Roseateles sp. NT4 TaxID=3453715 RepID=UPI003EE8616B
MRTYRLNVMSRFHDRSRRRIPRRRWATLALALLPLTMGLAACGERQADKEARLRGERYAIAKAVFEERCKTSGVLVKGVVKDVDGIELTKLRGEIPWGGKEYFDPMYPEAAMAAEHRGDDYIKQFLMSEFRDALHPEQRGQLAPHLTHNVQQLLPPVRGYRFVEYVNDAGTRFRCEATWKDGESNWTTGQHQCAPVASSSARYALDYEDIVDSADRELWIAGTKLKVIDKASGEVIAKLTRFVWDSGFGGSSTGRWPWSYASTSGSGDCPNVSGVKNDISRKFVDTVLVPRRQE